MPPTPTGSLHLSHPPLEKRMCSAPIPSSKVHPEPTAYCTAPADPACRALFLERTTSAPRDIILSLNRNISNALDRPIGARTLRCNICLENIPNTDCLVLEDCGRSDHSCCKSCISMYLRLRIEEGRVWDLRCPRSGTDGCEAKATEGELERWLGHDSVDKYRRFRRVQKDSQLRACPQCNNLCAPWVASGAPDPGRGSRERREEIVAEMSCDRCGQAFCYYHSNAHAVGPQACAAYEHEVLKKEKLLAMGCVAKKCPKCGVLTQKASGCNHMTCTCQAQWCWVCGKEITNVGWHYNPLRPMSCDQFHERTAQADHVRLTLLRSFSSLFTWPASIIACLFAGLFVMTFLVMLLVDLIIACLLLPALIALCCLTRNPDPVFDVLGKAFFFGAAIPSAIVVGIPFVCFCIIWSILALPLWLTLVPCGADSDSLHLMVSSPLLTLLTLWECVTPND